MNFTKRERSKKLLMIGDFDQPTAMKKTAVDLYSIKKIPLKTLSGIFSYEGLTEKLLADCK